MEKKYFYLTAAIVVLFLIVWFFSAGRFAGWGDEITHFSTAKGLVETGQYRTWAFDKGYASPYLYTRGLLITYLVSVIYKMTGLSLLAFRMIPLVFVWLTFLTFAMYICFRHRATAKALAYAAIFFFGQSFVFEQSVYVRVYAPLGWFAVMSLILYWEAAVALKKRSFVVGVLFVSASLLLLVLPAKDHWQVSHIAIYFLGFLLTLPVFGNILIKINAKLKNNLEIILGVGIVLFAPIVVFFLDLSMAHLIMNTKKLVLGRNYVTYWDNILGLIRYGLALNVCFWGIRWVLQRLKKNKVLDFYSWLFLVGIVSGILIGLFNPHNHVFFSRFFYVSVVIAVLGFSQVILRPEISAKTRRWMVAIFIFANLGLFVVNAYGERSNIQLAIEWLNKNLKHEDLLLVYASQLELHGGQSLSAQAYAVNPTQEKQDIHNLLRYILQSQTKEIYYLYTDHYQFRDRLYLWTAGENRSVPSDLFRYLKDVVPSQELLSGLRGCNLVRFHKDDLVMLLEKLLDQGYPPPFKSREKILLKKFLKLLNVRTDKILNACT